ncbi:MAG: TIGR04053 family radical SAM/SPASM domain-containing protein [bacterium]
MTGPLAPSLPVLPPGKTARAAKPDLGAIDFDRSPFLVIWEVTQACSLACLHCRAEACPGRSAGELSTEEAFALLDETRRFGPVLFVITGGDPLERPDIFEIIRHGADIGLRMTMTPAGTEKMTREKIREMKEAGLARLAVSLDGHDRESHDRFRGVAGSFDWTMNSIRWARAIGLEVQVNTTVTRFNEGKLGEIASMLAREDIALWSVFFLVPVGRGLAHHMVSPKKHEEIFHQLCELGREMPFDIKTTAAQHYRRVAMQRAAMDRLRGGSGRGAPFAEAPGFSAGVGRASKGVNDGRGFVFVSHLGDIMPSGFLPAAAGNVRRDSLVEVYRNSGMFRSLRQPEGYAGKCGYCDYRDVCGGSRSRAYAVTGNYLASEPYCTYRPRKPGSKRHGSNTYRGPGGESGALSRNEVMAALGAPPEPEPA